MEDNGVQRTCVIYATATTMTMGTYDNGCKDNDMALNHSQSITNIF